MGDKGEMTNQIKAMIFGKIGGDAKDDSKPKKPRAIAYDRHSLVEIGKNTASQTRPEFLESEYDNISRLDGTARWDPERWHAGTKAQHLKARKDAAAKERSVIAPLPAGQDSSWRKAKSEKRGLAMDEEAENGKNDETFGAAPTRLGPMRRSYKEGCKPQNTREEPIKEQPPLPNSWRDSRKSDGWRRNERGDDDKFSDFRKDDRENNYRDRSAQNNYRDRNNYRGGGGGNRYGRGRYGRDSPDEAEPEWMNADDGNDITFLPLEGLPGDNRGKEDAMGGGQGPQGGRDSPELVAFDENAFMGTTDDGPGGGALGGLEDGDLGGALEDDRDMAGLIKSSFMDIMKDDAEDSGGMGAHSKFSSFFDVGPGQELKPSPIHQLQPKPQGVAPSMPPMSQHMPKSVAPPMQHMPPQQQPAPPANNILRLNNLWNLPQPHQQQTEPQQSDRVSVMFSQLQQPRQAVPLMPLRPPGVGMPHHMLPGVANPPPNPVSNLGGGMPSLGGGMPPRGFISVEELEGPRRNASPGGDNQPAPDVKMKLMNLRNDFEQKNSVTRMMLLNQGTQGPTIQYQAPNISNLSRVQQPPPSQQQQMHQQMHPRQMDARAALDQRQRVFRYLSEQEKVRQLTPSEETFIKQYRAELGGGPFGGRPLMDQNLNPRDDISNRQNQNLDFNRQKQSFEEKLRQQSVSMGPPHPSEQVSKSFNQFTPTSVMRKMVHRKGDEGINDGRPHRNPKITPLEHTGVVRVPKGHPSERKLSNGGSTMPTMQMGAPKQVLHQAPQQQQLRSLPGAPQVLFPQSQPNLHLLNQSIGLRPPVSGGSINSAPPPTSAQLLFHQRLIPAQIRQPKQDDQNQLIHKLLQPQARRAFPDFG